MAIPIRVPRLGWNMEQGTFLGWLKPEGTLVRAGEPLFKLEGDKAVEDIEAADAGYLRPAPGGPREGDTVAVGAVLGYLTGEGEILEVACPSLAPRPAEVPEPQHTTPVAAPASSEAAPRQRITPRARKAAARLGLDWTRVRGTGRAGRIREKDVVGSAEPSRDRPETSPDALRVRQVIAQRMVHSLQITAPVTLTTTADATNLVNLRHQFKAAAPGEADVPSITDFFARLVARLLPAHPALNSRWQDDRPVASTAIHLGIAVDTDRGLVVPVLRDVPGLSLAQVAQRSRELIRRARSGQLTAAELQGGTFSITNLGAFGIDAFTPIINWPECAILGIGRIHKVPAVVDNQVVPREQVTLSLTFDHRLVDGAPAARFLQVLARAVENPAPHLVG